MAAIIEIDYYNAFWTKKIYTGAPIGPNDEGTLCYPGPVSFGDAVLGLGNVTAFGYPDPALGPGPNVVVPSALDKWPVWNLGSGYYGNSLIKHKLTTNFYVEDSRIRGGFNNTQVNLGVRAYLNEENPLQTRKTEM